MKTLPHLLSSFQIQTLLFWRKNPALLIAITLLVGISSPFWEIHWAFIWCFIWSCYLLFLKGYSRICLLIIAVLYGHLSNPMPTQEKTIESRGYFSISSIQERSSFFTKSIMIKGFYFTENKKIPCVIFERGKKLPIKANRDYIVEGTLSLSPKQGGFLRVKKYSPVPKSYCFAQKRFDLKKKLKKYIKKNIPSFQAASLLSAIVTGDVDNRFLRFEFGRIGLQHLLAISGFHFAIFTFFLSWAFSLFLSRKATLIALLISVYIAFLFIGSMPSVQRSFLVISLYLFSKIIQRRSFGLNLLGAALLIELLLDPYICTSIGFQLSFSSSLGILLFYPHFQKWVPPRKDRDSLSFVDAHIYLLARFIKNAFLITCAVSLVNFPILLTHFHKIPLFSLIYNLFIPFILTLSTMTLFCAISIDFILPFLAKILFSISNFLTNTLLLFTSHPPPSLDYSLMISSFPPYFTPIYLFCLLNFTIALFLLPKTRAVR